MNIWQYMEAHPWWTLLYLVVVAQAIGPLVKVIVRKAKD